MNRLPGQGQMMNTGQCNMMNQNQGYRINPGQGQMMNQGQGQMMMQGHGQMIGSGQGQIMNLGQMLNPGQVQMINPGQGQIINTNQGQMMNPGQGQMMNQGHMMVGHTGSQGQMMAPHQQPVMSHGQMYMPRGQVSMNAGNNVMGMRMPSGMPARPPGVAPPPYSQAHAVSYQQRQKSSGYPTNQPGRKSEEQIQKEKYFHEQQSRLKQFKSSTGSGLDPNKLIESMLPHQDPAKHKPTKMPDVSKVEDSDDGFGDFLGSPESASSQPKVEKEVAMATSVSSSRGNQVQQPPKPVVVEAPKQEKKDLTKMMLDSCDLSAPQKARLFVKPSLKELPSHAPSSTTNIPMVTSHAARSWDKAEELSDLFIQEAVKDEQTHQITKKATKATSPPTRPPTKPPAWMSDDTLIPALYRQVLEASLVEGLISTERLYPILIMSGLPKEALGHLWSVCNKTTPGQLTPPELYQLLAVIALTQNNYSVESIDILNRCPQPPVPFLSPSGPSPIPVSGHAPFSCPVPVPASGHTPFSSPPPIAASGHTPFSSPPPIPASGHAPFSSPAPIPASGHAPFTSPVSVPASGPSPASSPGLPPAAFNPMLSQGFHFPPSQQSAIHAHVVMANQLPADILATATSQTFPSQQLAHGSVPIPNQDVSSHISMATAAVSSPATISVTNLPPAVPQQKIMSNLVQKTNASVDDDDDFADFQAAVPVVPATVTLTSTAEVPPVVPPGTASSKVSKYVYSAPAHNDSKVPGCLSTREIHGTVESFFGTDDSSDVAKVKHRSVPATSPDDDYFDGYKSADSKPSDSTSQFSTDQSEGEDFKNFENYLDEFQRKKEQFDKESPLHRPIPKFSLPENQQTSPSRIFPKAPVHVQKIPMPAKLQGNIGTPAHISSDEFSDFADFQSAPLPPPASSSAPASKEQEVDRLNKPDDLKATGSASDLIGDEDKYAALRCLDFSEPPEATATVLHEPEAVNEETEEENWADFQAATSGESVATPSKKHPDVATKPDEEAQDSDWASFDSAAASSHTEPSEDLFHLAAKSSTDLFRDSPERARPKLETHFDVHTSTEGNTSDDWDDFQGSGGAAAGINDNQTKSDVTGDKKSDILNLFAVKSETSSLQSKDFRFDTEDEIPTKETGNGSNGVFMDTGNNKEKQAEKTSKQPRLSDDDFFMKPPPLDDSAGVDDDEFGDGFGSFTRGYDLEHMHQPHQEENGNKRLYGGVFGVNKTTIVTGHKTSNESKTQADDGSKAKVAIEITKYPGDTDKENDSDSASSKDNDIVFQGKFELGKDLGEDTQSVSSLDFVMNKRLMTLKDGDTNSMTSSASNEFGTFETGEAGLPESRSVDSLDLRKDFPNGSAENSDRDTKDESPERDSKGEGHVTFELEPNLGPGLPIVGDRYSSIIPEIQGSDKHAYEWQRCLDQCCRMIQDANNIFNSISSSNVCNEVMRSSQGSQYIQGVIEIYKVSCRILVAMEKAGIHSDQLTQQMKDIDLAWNNLTAFLVGASVMPDELSLDFSYGFLSSDDTPSQYRACGVCVLDVDLKVRGQNQVDNAKLTYAGRQYHSTCANFWINCVDSTLPALKLPELL